MAAILAACVPAPTPSPLPPGVAAVTVSAGSGHGGGKIYYSTSFEGRRGGVALIPGFMGDRSTIEWYGPALAQHGFVVFTLDALSGFDQPPARANQLLAALDYLTDASSVRDRVDPTRLAVGGHSMGGGGALLAAEQRPDLKAALPLAPWNGSGTDFSDVEVPTMIVACEDDTTAPVASHAEPFYQSLSASRPKAFLEMDGGSHMCANSSNSTIERQAVAWMKRFVDGDTSQSALLCPPPTGVDISRSLATCPF